MKGDIRFNKKGLSPVIASVLLVSLVVILAGIIFLWAQGFISEQIEKFDKPIEFVCQDVDYQAILIDDSGRDVLEVVNRGNIPISAFEIKVSSGGDSFVNQYALKVNAGASQFTQIDLGHVKPSDIVTVYPILLGTVSGQNKNQYFACTDNDKTLRE